jgi:hypothetical protein
LSSHPTPCGPKWSLQLKAAAPALVVDQGWTWRGPRLRAWLSLLGHPRLGDQARGEHGHEDEVCPAGEVASTLMPDSDCRVLPSPTPSSTLMPAVCHYVSNNLPPLAPSQWIPNPMPSTFQLAFPVSTACIYGTIFQRQAC